MFSNECQKYGEQIPSHSCGKTPDAYCSCLSELSNDLWTFPEPEKKDFRKEDDKTVFNVNKVPL